MPFHLRFKLLPQWLCALALNLEVMAAPQAPKLPAGLQVLREIFLDGEVCRSLTYSPDGTKLACGGHQGTVAILDSATGEVERSFRASNDGISKLRFAPDGHSLATVGPDLTVFDLRANTRMVRTQAGSHTALDWSRDGRLLACVLKNRAVALLRATDLSLERAFNLPNNRTPAAVAISPDSKSLAVGDGTTTRIFDTATGRLAESIQRSDHVTDLAYSQAGHLFRAGSMGNYDTFGGGKRSFPASLKGQAEEVYNIAVEGNRCALRTSEGVYLMARGSSPVRVADSGCLALHPDGHQWALGKGGVISIYRDNEKVRSFPCGARAEIQDAVITGDGQFVAARQHEGGIQVFSAVTGQLVKMPTMPTNTIMLPHRGGPELVTYVDHHVQYWLLSEDKETQHPVRTIHHRRLGPPSSPYWISQLRLGPRGRYLTFATKIYDLHNANLGPKVIADLPVGASVVSPTGNLIAGFFGFQSGMGPGFGKVYIHHADGRRLGSFRVDYPLKDIRFTPDGTRLLALGGPRTEIYDPRKARRIDTIDRRWIHAQFLDADHLIGIDSAGEVQVYSLKENQSRATLRLEPWCRSLGLSKDGRCGLAAFDDRVVVFSIAQ